MDLSEKYEKSEIFSKKTINIMALRNALYCGNGLIWREYSLVDSVFRALAAIFRLIFIVRSAKLSYSRGLHHIEKIIRDLRNGG